MDIKNKEPSKTEIEKVEDILAEIFRNIPNKPSDSSLVSGNKNVYDVVYWYLVANFTNTSSFLPEEYVYLNAVVDDLRGSVQSHIDFERLEWTVDTCKSESGCHNEQCEAYEMEGDYGSAECYLLSAENLASEDGREELSSHIDIAIEDFTIYDIKRLKKRFALP